MPKWKLVTEFTFDSAHYIKDYNGPCGRMHGHTYTVRIEAISNQLHSSEYCPHPVMVADFRSLRWAKKDVTKGGLDHCILNEVMPPEYETTAEMIAKYIYDETKKKLPEGVKSKLRYPKQLILGLSMKMIELFEMSSLIFDFINVNANVMTSV